LVKYLDSVINFHSICSCWYLGMKVAEGKTVQAFSSS
jgi:hypothetical protein